MNDDNFAEPNDEFEHVAFEIMRVMGSIDYLNNRTGGRFKYAHTLVKQALDELDSYMAELDQKTIDESEFN